MDVAGERGRLYVGTSGFSYPSWVPRFYAPGKASRKLLVAYSARLPAVELHTTFYRRPNEEQIAKWLRETPRHFRFCPKAQRGTAWRAWTDTDPRESFAWLRESMSVFGERLGCVLMSARGTLERDDDALTRVLDAWPGDLPLALELMHPSWQVDEVYERLDARGVTLVANDWDDREAPVLRHAGQFVYLRLRRSRYGSSEVSCWADRLEPVLGAGVDAFVFFRHDDDGQMALHAEQLLRQVGGSTGS